MNELEKLLRGHNAAQIGGPCQGCGKTKFTGFCYLDDSQGFHLPGGAAWPRYPWWREQLPHEVEFVVLCSQCAAHWPDIDRTTYQTSMFSDLVDKANTAMKGNAAIDENGDDWR
jgi:hypothetical protein